MSYATIRVEPDGGEPYDVPVIARDVLLWERTTQGASVAKLAKEQRITDMYKLAYLGARRLGRFDGTQAEFEAGCDIENVPGADEESGVDPTNPAP